MYLMDAWAQTAHQVLTNQHHIGIPDFGIQRLNARNPILEVYPDIYRRMQRAPRFLFDNAAIDAAVELTLGRPKVMLEAMQHCRVPYNTMWIEWEEAGRQRIRETFKELAIEQPGRPLPKRVGCLFECERGGRKGTITWSWTIDDGPPNTSPIVANFDLDEQFHQSDERTAGLMRGNICQLWADNPVQLEALLGIWRTAVHEPSSWGWRYLEVLDRSIGGTDRRIADSYADVYGEYIVAWAVMLLLTTSRKAVDYKPVDRSKLNKVRAKKREALLFDHNVVTMHINPPQAHQQGQPLSYKRKSPRIHMVGRYLNRRGDKHWITEPFLRGQGEWPQRHVHVKG
jgi:hypothetical protein